MLVHVLNICMQLMSWHCTVPAISNTLFDTSEYLDTLVVWWFQQVQPQCGYQVFLDREEKRQAPRLSRPWKKEWLAGKGPAYCELCIVHSKLGLT